MSNPGSNNLPNKPVPRTISEIQYSRLPVVFVLCVLAGIASGVTAMAISVLVTTILNTPAGHFAGMDVTAIVFVVFCVLGWFSSAVILWTRARTPDAGNQRQRESK